MCVCVCVCVELLLKTEIYRIYIYIYIYGRDILLGILLLEPCIYVCENQQIHQLFIQFINYIQPQYSIDCSSIEHLSEGIRNAP
jgi:hypothetical protein